MTRVPKTYWLAPILLAPVLGILLFGGVFKHERSTDELLGDLKSSKETEQLIAVRKLQVRSDEAAKIVPALIEALKDRHAEIRQGAAIKLGVYGQDAQEAIPALKEAVRDKDARVREAAKKALERIDPSAAPKDAVGK